MATKERGQNPVVGDTIILRMVSYNGNAYSNVQAINKIDIFLADPTEKTCTDPCGKRLITSIPGSSVNLDSTGNYSLPLVTSTPLYTIGTYTDEWNVVFNANDTVSLVDQTFKLYPNLWYTSPTPAVYGFDFRFQPNRIRKDSKKWIIIQIVPNVPKGTDIERYYTSLAVGGTLKISIEQSCGPCVPQEDDLRLIVDADTVTVRDGVFAFYYFDTTDYDCGIYNTWFQLDVAGITEISAKNQFQIF